MLSGMLSACLGASSSGTKRKRLSLAEALEIARVAKSEAELQARMGPPHATWTFNPGNPSDSNFYNRMSREEWKKVLVTNPSDLFDNSPLGTKILSYSFDDGMPVNPAGDALQFFVDKAGVVLGYIQPQMPTRRHPNLYLSHSR